jgi:hypothetical protein
MAGSNLVAPLSRREHASQRGSLESSPSRQPPHASSAMNEDPNPLQPLPPDPDRRPDDPAPPPPPPTDPRQGNPPYRVTHPARQ